MKQTTISNGQVPVSKVFTNGNIREVSQDNEQFNALVESIGVIGQQVPVTVYEEDGKFCILTGHQRFKALQELNKEYIKVAVVDKPTTEDHSLIQYHENMFRVEMSLFEQVDGLRKIASENPKATYAELSARFGKGVSWVSARMKIANLIKPLYTPEFINDKGYEHAVKIGSYSQAKQTLAFKNVGIDEDGDISPWALRNALDDSCPEPESMKLLFSDLEVYEYWDSYKKKKKAKSLFDEVALQWDWDFVDYCLKDAYPDRLALLKQIPVDPLEGYNELHHRLDWTNLFTIEEKKLKEFQAWNGNYGNLVVKVKKTTAASSSMKLDAEPVERSRFQGCGTKLARAVVPEYFDYVTKGLRYEDQVVKWIVGVGEFRWSIGSINETLHKDLLPNFGINEMGNLLFDEYVSHCIENSTVLEISKLASLDQKLSIKGWINSQFETEGKDDLRKDILSAFKTVDLVKAYNPKAKTKGSIVEELKTSAKKFKFNGIFKDDDANFWNQQCKTYRESS